MNVKEENILEVVQIVKDNSSSSIDDDVQEKLIEKLVFLFSDHGWSPDEENPIGEIAEALLEGRFDDVFELTNAFGFPHVVNVFKRIL